MQNNAAFHWQISLQIVEISQISSDAVPKFTSIHPKAYYLKGKYECIMHAYITDTV